MLGVVIEIQGNNIHLSHYRGFLQICQDNTQTTRIAYDEILSLVISSYACTISNRLLQELGERNIPAIISGKNFEPLSIMLPIVGNHELCTRIKYQISAKQPLKKQVWSHIVKQKILNQETALCYIGSSEQVQKTMHNFIYRVKSGDTTNVEGQSARQYFSNIFGTDFRRDRNAKGINSMLNYGYMVIRSGIARAIAGSGLHPSLGIHHKSWSNTLQLADDFMEPYRPMIDYIVYSLCIKYKQDTLSPLTKKILASILSININGPRGITNISQSMLYVIQSFVQVLMGVEENVYFPNFPLQDSFDTVIEKHLLQDSA